MLSGLSQCSLASLGLSGTHSESYPAGNSELERTCRDQVCDSSSFGGLRPQKCVTVIQIAPASRAFAALASDPSSHHVGEPPPLRESTQLPQMAFLFMYNESSYDSLIRP